MGLFGVGISFPLHRGDRLSGSTKEPRPCSRRLYAGRHVGRKQVSPTLFPEYGIYSNFDDFLKFSTRHQRFTFVRLHGPYLTVSSTAFSHLAHHHLAFLAGYGMAVDFFQTPNTRCKSPHASHRDFFGKHSDTT
jgi:hypothetical protein